MSNLRSPISQELRPKEPEAFLQLLYQVSRELSVTLDPDIVLERILRRSIESVGAASGSIIVLNEAGKPIKSSLLFGKQAKLHDTPELGVTFEQGLAGWVARHAQAVLIPDTSQDARWLKRPDDLPTQTGAKSAVSAPIFSGESLIGVITLVHPSPGRFTAAHLSLVEAIGQIAGAAIRNALLYDRLQVALQRYQALFQDSVDAILITDRNGTVVEANVCARRVFGVQGEAIEGRDIRELHQWNAQLLGTNFEALNGEHVATYASVLKPMHGEEIPIQVFARRIQGADGELMQWILRDISEQKMLDQMREDLMAMIYHDIRSPLSTVLTTVNMLSLHHGQFSDEEQTTMVQIAKRSCEHIQRLIDMLLDMYLLEAGQPLSDRAMISCEKLVQDCLQVLHPLAEQRRMQIALQLSPHAGEVYIDEEMIQRVLVNLVDNAIKFSPVESTIWIGTVDHDHFVEIWVRDSGPGIALQDRERIFDKFALSRGESRLRRHGLGLPFSRLVVNAHGGRIWVGDETPGACIHFTLPKQPNGTI